MAQQTYYDICLELKDGSLTAPFLHASTKRNAIKSACAATKVPASEVWNVVVMDRLENVAVAVFPVPPKSAP